MNASWQQSVRALRNVSAGALLLAAGLGVATAETPVVQAWNILNTATGDSNIENRTASVSSLGLITRNAHAEELAIKALSDPKSEVRTAAANALGGIAEPASIPELKKALKDTDVGVVLAAAHSLYLMKDKAGYEVYYAVLTGNLKGGGGLLADQRKMLDDPKKMAQFGFETGVGFIPFGGLGLTAFKMLTKDDASQVRAAAAKLLAGDPDPRSGAALVTAASDKSWIVRGAALDAIARRGERSLAVQIKPQLDDSKTVVKYLAAAAVIHLNTMPAAKSAVRKP